MSELSKSAASSSILLQASFTPPPELALLAAHTRRTSRSTTPVKLEHHTGECGDKASSSNTVDLAAEFELELCGTGGPCGKSSFRRIKLKYWSFQTIKRKPREQKSGIHAPPMLPSSILPPSAPSHRQPTVYPRNHRYAPHSPLVSSLLFPPMHPSASALLALAPLPAFGPLSSSASTRRLLPLGHVALLSFPQCPAAPCSAPFHCRRADGQDGRDETFASRTRSTCTCWSPLFYYFFVSLFLCFSLP